MGNGMTTKRRVRVADGFDAAVDALVAVLERGGAAVFPTETVYGVGVAAGDAAALERLKRLKGRQEGKPFQLLVADVAMARELGAIFSSRAERLGRAFWPGPLTMVVPDGAGGGTLGIRVPDSPFMLAAIRALGRPIASSSANPAGMPPPCDADAADVFADGRDGVELVIDGGPVRSGTPSSVVRCDGDDLEILREGGIDSGTLRNVWDA